MPVKQPPRERPLLTMFLTEYENGAWKSATWDWVEERIDGAVEVIAKRADCVRLAIEHTIVQPFVGEKFDSQMFNQAFGRIDSDPELNIRDRHLEVVIPVAAIPKGYKWDEVGQGLHTWLQANHRAAPEEGKSEHVVQVGGSSKAEPFSLKIELLTRHVPDTPGATRILRGPMPDNLDEIVEKALGDKLPKLIATAADKFVLLIERQQPALAPTRILSEITGLAHKFPQLKHINEIWIVDTSAWKSEGCVYFDRFEESGRYVEKMDFKDGALRRHWFCV